MELALAQDVAQRASSTWDKFKKERDFHRMHHKRVAQEKNKLITDIKQLKAHYAKYEPTILELKRKYESAMKEKMLANLERDKMAAKVGWRVEWMLSSCTSAASCACATCTELQQNAKRGNKEASAEQLLLNQKIEYKATCWPTSRRRQ